LLAVNPWRYLKLEHTSRSATDEDATPMSHSGSVRLTAERLKAIAPLWKATHENLRRMDSLDLRETEPATCFVWRVEEE
jgi:hypothetical protein